MSRVAVLLSILNMEGLVRSTRERPYFFSNCGSVTTLLRQKSIEHGSLRLRIYAIQCPRHQFTI